MPRSQHFRFNKLVRPTSRNRLSRSSSQSRKPTPRFRRGLEQLEERRLLAGDLLITTEVPGQLNYNLMQFTQQGSLVNSQKIPQSPTATEYQDARGLTVDPLGNVHIVDGFSAGFLDTYSPGQQPAWSYQTTPNWLVGSNVTYGEAAAYKNYVFASAQAANGSNYGILRFNTSGGAPTLFAVGTSSYQVTLGLDGNLYELVGVGLEPYQDPVINEYNPDTLALVRSFHLTTPFTSDIRSIAVDGSGDIYAADDWAPSIIKYDPSGTTVLKTQTGYNQNIVNVAIDNDGQIAVGDTNGAVYLTDESLNSLQSFQTNQWNAFVTFDHYIGTAQQMVPPTLTVNTLLDASAASPTTSPFDTNGNGQISLRSAVEYLNAQGTGGTIDFNLPSGSTIHLTRGQIEIQKSMNISGPGAGLLAVDQTSFNSRLFQVDSAATVAMSGLTLSGGRTTGGPGSGDGGAIWNNGGNLTLSGMTLTQNTANSARGGGIYNSGVLTAIDCTFSSDSAGNGGALENFPGTATIEGSTFSGNSAWFGGGIYNLGQLTVNDSTLAGNSTNGSDPTGLYSGAGLYSDGGTVTVSASTFAGNSARGQGGGIMIQGGSLALTNSTLSGNSATDTGGGIMFYVSGGSGEVTGSTLSNNSASSGGGIDVFLGSFAIANTIVAGNTGTASDPDVEGRFTATAHDLIGIVGDASGFNASGSSASLVGTANAPIDPKLGALADNGGPTQTLALGANSPAIGAAGALTTLSAGPSIIALSSTATTVSVVKASFLAVGDALKIDNEIVTVTSVDDNSNTITVVRGQDGTSAANHASGAALALAYDQRGLPRKAAPDIGAFEIQIVTPSVTVTDPSGAYTGSAYSVTAASVVGQGGTVLASLGDPSLSYSYYQGTLTAAQIASATPLPDAPTNVGDYTVVAHFTSDVAGYTNADSAPTPFSITPAKVSYTIGNDKQVYGSAAKLANDLGATIDTGVNGETLDITYASTGDTATANAGSYPITGTLSDGSGSLSNYSVTLNNGTLTVDPYAFTYTIGNDSQTYGSPADLAKDLGTTIDTGVNGQTLGITYASTGDTATANAGNYPITGTLSAGSGSLSNYSVTLKNGTLTVDPYAFTYTIGNDSQTYGSPADLAKDLGTTIDTGVNGQTLGITYASTGDTATANAGNYPITGTLSAGSGSLSNYSVTLKNGTLTVDPYAFTYTIGNDSQTYGSPADLAKDLGTTIDTGVNGQTLGITYASTGDTATANAGSYPITGTLSAGSGSLSNYSVTLNNGTLTVDPYAFTYTIGNDSQTYGSPADLAKDLGTIIDTGVNGQTLGITYASTGDTATANVGSYAITGTVADGSGLLSNYTVTLNNGTLTVDPYAFSYTIGNDLQVEGFPANLAADLPATISGVNGETLNISYASTGDTVSAAPGAYPITGTLSSGTGTLANYSVTLNPGTLTVAGPGATAIGDVLYLIGGNTNDHVDVSPVGPSGTGSSGIQLDASLNGVRIHDQVYSQSFKTIYVVGFGGNDHIDFAPSLTIPTVVREGDGNDQVWLGNGNNTVTVGNGNDDIRVGDGNNVIVAGSGSDSIQAGNGDNLIVGGLGHSNVSAGNGNNILIDGSVSQSADQLWAVLDEWMAGDVADVQADLAAHVTYNTTKANSLQAGTGRDWFWENYAKDRVNIKPGDLVN